MSRIGEVRDQKGILLFYMFDSALSPCSRAFRIHRHVEYEFTLILNGNGKYMASKEYDIAAGDVFFYKNNEPHCVSEVRGEEMTFLNIHISPLYFRYIAERGEKEGFAASFLQKNFSSNRLRDFLPASDAQQICLLMGKIAEEFQVRAEGYTFMVQSYLNEMLVILTRYALPVIDTHTPLIGNYERIFASLVKIEDAFTEPLYLEDLARTVNLEKTYYSALFKRLIGISPMEYIIIKRIDRSVELLRHTEQSVLDIAVSCGFNNTANFNKQFKKYTGTTPRAVRKSHKKIN